jgi:hypothetical protein
MKNRPKWRRGFGFAQIMAMILVVIPTSLFIITLLFDYWAAMQIDNRLKLMSHRAIMAINNSEDLSSTNTLLASMTSDEQTLISSMCPSSMPNVTFTREGNMPSGQTKIQTLVKYDKFNRLGTKELSSIITSYSYRDQNGSFKLECKG